MPLMEITPEMVGPNRTGLAVSYVQAIMLWPNDLPQREQAMGAAEANAIAANIDTAPPSLLPELAMRLAEAVPLKTIWQQAEKPRVQGFMAGELLWAAISEHKNGGIGKFQSIKTEILAKYAERYNSGLKDSASFKLKSSTLETNIWAKYKSVSHLWAAYILTTTSKDATFPCHLSEFPNFLGLSECLRRVGQDIPFIRRGERLLVEDQQWRPPAHIDLPQFTLLPGS
jgi:hypothetical protein